MDIGITTRKSIFRYLNYFKVTRSETEVSEQVYCIIPVHGCRQELYIFVKMFS